MRDIDKKRLVFAFYLSEETFNNPIANIHFYFLSRYINMFDEVIVGIIKDDGLSDFYIEEFEKRFLSFYHKNISFKIYENTQYRETLVFYNEIATKLAELDGVTFFAHGKYSSEMDTEELIEWICGLYYFNLEYEYDYQATGVCFWGNPLITESDFFIKAITNKYRWYYSGTFYWTKTQELHKYMTKKGIELPVLTNRYYDEMFPGEIADADGFGISLEQMYIKGNGYGVDDIFQALFHGEKLDSFYEIYNEVLSNYKNGYFG